MPTHHLYKLISVLCKEEMSLVFEFMSDAFLSSPTLPIQTTFSFEGHFTSSTYHQPVTLPGCSKVRTSVSVANLCLAAASSLSSPTATVTFTHLASNQTPSINTDYLEEPETKIKGRETLFTRSEKRPLIMHENLDDATNNIHKQLYF